jgi:hypothetical protein
MCVCRQYELMQRKARLESIQQTRLQLEQEEERLFFFQNWDRIDMEKEEKVAQWVRTLPRTDWNLVSTKLYSSHREFRLRYYVGKKQLINGVV